MYRREGKEDKCVVERSSIELLGCLDRGVVRTIYWLTSNLPLGGLQMGTLEETKRKAEEEKSKAQAKQAEGKAQESGAKAVEKVAKTGEDIKKKVMK